MTRQFEEPVMNARFVLISAALMSASAFAAEPPKAPVHPADQQQPAPAQVVLASAADNHASTPDPQSGTATKRPRVARVTTCRCGGQEADPPAQPEQ